MANLILTGQMFPKKKKGISCCEELSGGFKVKKEKYTGSDFS
jgi:hypothetical protein